MLIDPNQVVVSEADCASHTVRTLQVHHRQFPEIWGAGFTEAEGVTHLVHRLELFLEGASSDFRRDAIQHALADIRAYVDSRAEVDATAV
jgi:hypothetical protein